MCWKIEGLGLRSGYVQGLNFYVCRLDGTGLRNRCDKRMNVIGLWNGFD